jgi:uncharacterized protein YkwD
VLGIVVMLVAGLVWPTLDNRINTALVADDPGCPHSSDFPAIEGGRAERQELLCLLNRERAKNGLPGLREEARLDQAAQVQSNDIVARRFFAHVNPDGRAPSDRIDAAGYPRSPLTGENIAWGEEREGTPVRVVRAWMHSPGHRANILQPRYTEIGIGVTPGAPTSVPARAAVYATTFGAGPLSVSAGAPGS